MKAVEYFIGGNSCSESVVLSAIDDGYCDESLFCMATPFSGGIGSGCLCGAISAVVMIIGHRFGKNNKYGNPPIAKELAKQFISDFKEVHNATCCRVLSRGFEFHSAERKAHCTNMVEFCYKKLDEIIEKSVKNG